MSSYERFPHAPAVSAETPTESLSDGALHSIGVDPPGQPLAGDTRPFETPHYGPSPGRVRLPVMSAPNHGDIDAQTNRPLLR
jgi:hypothetical protein